MFRSTENLYLLFVFEYNFDCLIKMSIKFDKENTYLYKLKVQNKSSNYSFITD